MVEASRMLEIEALACICGGCLKEGVDISLLLPHDLGKGRCPTIPELRMYICSTFVRVQGFNGKALKSKDSEILLKQGCFYKFGGTMLARVWPVLFIKNNLNNLLTISHNYCDHKQ